MTALIITVSTLGWLALGYLGGYLYLHAYRPSRDRADITSVPTRVLLTLLFGLFGLITVAICILIRTLSEGNIMNTLFFVKEK